MREFAKNLVLHALGAFITFSLAAAVSIYVLDKFDSALGKGLSMELSIYVAVILSVLASVGALLGLALNRNAQPSALICFFIGVLVAILALSLHGRFGLPEWFVYVIVVTGSAVLCYLGQFVVRPPASTSSRAQPTAAEAPDSDA